MTIRKGLPAKLALTDANDTRYDFRNLVTCNADGSPRGGLTSPVGANVVTSTATMNVAVAAFNAVAVRDNGVVFLANDGTQNVLLDAAPVANSRIDVIYAKQNDSSSTVTTPDGNDTPVLTFAKGTAAASPTKPAIPTGAVELATVLIPAGATATNSSSPAVVITQTAQFTAAPGAPVPVRSFSEMSGWVTARTGQLAEVIADSTSAYNGLYRWTGSGWRLPRLARSHWEFTSTDGVVDGSVRYPQWSLDGSNTTDPVGGVVASWNNGNGNASGLQFGETGLYLVQAKAVLATNITSGTAVFQAQTGSTFEQSDKSPSGNQNLSFTLPYTVAAAGQQLTILLLKTNGSTAANSFRVRVDRIA